MKILLFFLTSTITVISAQAFWKDLDRSKNTSEAIHTLPEKVLSLEETIAACPYSITEGYMTQGQKEQFNACLKSYGSIRSILEIGLNAGHSAENFFQNCQDLEAFVSVDICFHPYTPYAIEFFQNKYPGRFFSLVGDSLDKVPELAESQPNVKFDLIFIDGNHSYKYCLRDILNCCKIAHEKTHLWIDDYNDSDVAAAIETAVRKGIIEIENIHEDIIEHRSWVEAHYLL